MRQAYRNLTEAAQQCVYLAAQVRRLAEQLHAARYELEQSGWQECVRMLSDTDAWQQTVQSCELAIERLSVYEQKLRDGLHMLTRIKKYPELCGEKPVRGAAMIEREPDCMRQLVEDLARLSEMALSGRRDCAQAAGQLPLPKAQWDMLYDEIGTRLPFGPFGGGIGPLHTYLDTLRQADTELAQIIPQMEASLSQLENAVNDVKTKYRQQMEKEAYVRSLFQSGSPNSKTRID